MNKIRRIAKKLSTKISVKKSLINACLDEDFESIKKLIKSGTNPNKSSKDGNTTPLIIISQKGNLKILKYLLDNGADPNKTDKYGYTPLVEACIKQDSKIIKYLLENGADVGASNNLALIESCKRGDLKIIKLLIKYGADINTPSKSGDTPLMVTSYLGFYDIMKYLISKKAELYGDISCYKEPMICYERLMKDRNIEDSIFRKTIRKELIELLKLKEINKRQLNDIFSKSRLNKDVIDSLSEYLMFGSNRARVKRKVRSLKKQRK